MSRFEEMQTRLENLSPIPVNMPKLYLLGDTGAGKTTIVRKILGTEELKFPSVQQKRTTVAITEYVLSKDLPFQATYLFKTKAHIAHLVAEILEIAVDRAYTHYRKTPLAIDAVAETLEETPDERFRLRYILTAEQRAEAAQEIISFMPSLDATVRRLCSDLQSTEGELDIVVEMALDQHRDTLEAIKASILEQISIKVSEVCGGHKLFSDVDFWQHSAKNLADFIAQAKLVLSSTSQSISPVIEYARLQGNLLAPWLPKNPELILIDGEGIGHDARETASRLSARHFDYFHFADSIILVEECRKPFASGGKSAIEEIVRSGYSKKFNLVFTKLDEVEVGDDEDSNRADQIRSVRKGLANVKNALKENGAALDIEDERIYHLSNMNRPKLDADSVNEIGRLLDAIRKTFERTKPQFVEPTYDFEMLSSYLSNSSRNFSGKWDEILRAKHWQTVKALNRRMCWKEDEFRDMKPVADFHSEVTRELEHFISRPSSWVESATQSLQEESITRVRQEFSKKLLEFARTVILTDYGNDWNNAMDLRGPGSTADREKLIDHILKEALPDYQAPQAIKMKDSIKQLLTSAIEVCKRPTPRGAKARNGSRPGRIIKITNLKLIPIKGLLPSQK